MPKIIYPFILLLLLSACQKNAYPDYLTKAYKVGPGPEDMVLDRSTQNPRFLISCADRRDEQQAFGEIISLTPESGKVDTLVRVGQPDSLYFHPHGIFLDSLSEPQKLYAISHEHDSGFHPIYIWDLVKDTLFFREIVATPLVYSPNALTLGAHGEIYVVNDAGERGNFKEKALKLKRANLVRIEKNAGEWTAMKVAEKLGYPAGINRIGDTIYVGDAVLHKLHVFRIENENLRKLKDIKKLRGNDNIRVQNGKLYLAGHVKPLKFVGHAKDPSKESPVTAWEFDPDNGNIKTLFKTDGSLISAGSSCMVLNNKLYICQVFDPYILEVNLDTSTK